MGALESMQLTLGMSLKDGATFENFYAGKNVEIVAWLKKMAVGQGEHFIYLSASRGQGGSHLLQACCQLASVSQQESVYLPLTHFFASNKTPPLTILEGLDAFPLVCIDDMQVIAGVPEWEEAIFHFYNCVQEAGNRMLVAANTLPQHLGLQLPDLTSRLSAGIVYQLQPLNDQEKLFVLIERAKRRGIALSEEVGKYLLTHCPRDMGALLTALDILDKASLSAQRRLTVPFIKEVLQHASYPNDTSA